MKIQVTKKTPTEFIACINEIMQLCKNFNINDIIASLKPIISKLSNANTTLEKILIIIEAFCAFSKLCNDKD